MKNLRKIISVTTIAFCLFSSLTLPGYCDTSKRQSKPSKSGVVLAERNSATASRVTEAFGRLPLTFESNTGQADPQVKFISRGNGFSFYLSPAEAILDLQGRARASTTRLKMKLEGADALARIRGDEKQPARTNYFVGNSPDRWRANIPTWSRVRVEDIYPGIDLIYYGNRQSLEYDYIVSPGAKVSSISMAFEGAEKICIDKNGDLVLTTPGGEVRHKKPFAYQEIDGVRHEVAARYVVRGKHRVSFQVARRDPRRPLIIDPVLSYSSFLGDRFSEGISVAVDAAGNAYIVGRTNSSDFPVTPGVVQTAINNADDIFITKLNATGSGLIFSTYLGGSGGEVPSGIAVDAEGNVYLTGTTLSRNFPITGNAFQSSGGGDSLDAFVTKLNSTGTAIIYSSYLGGRSEEFAYAIAVDSAGSAYVTGSTNSTDFPVTAGAIKRAIGGFILEDAFVTKIAPSGSSLIYSTYLGGDQWTDWANSIAVDSEGNAYVTGIAGSTDFPTTPGAIKTVHNGWQDAFVSKLNADGSSLIYSTLLGGSLDEIGSSIAVNSNAEAFVSGYTKSRDLPTMNASQNRPGSDSVIRSADGGTNWTGAGGGVTTGSGGVMSLVIDPRTRTTLYAGTDSGAFKSLDGGNNWNGINTGMTDGGDAAVIRDIVIDPNNSDIVYAAAFSSPRGVFKSTDGGNHWMPAGLNDAYVQTLAINAQNPSILFAGVAVVSSLPGGAFRSTDGGNTWSLIDELSNLDVLDLVIDPADASKVYACTSAGLFKSADGGNSWIRTRVDNYVATIAIDPAAPSTLYISTEDSAYEFLNAIDGRGNPRRRRTEITSRIANGVYKSNDGGQSWNAINNGFPLDGPAFDEDFFPRVLLIDPQSPSTIYAGSEYGLHRSTNGGNQWNVVMGGAAVSPKVFAAAIDRTTSPSTLYASSRGVGDAFLAKLNAQGTALIYSTYLGGLDDDSAAGLAIDLQGNAYVTGVTISKNFPTKAGALQTTFNGGRGDAFVVKVDAAGAIVYSSYLGGANIDLGRGIAAGPNGDAYITGVANNGFPITPGSFDMTHDHFSGAAFVARVAFTSKTPSITRAEMIGKKLHVHGENFTLGAVIMVEDREYKTSNDAASPASLLISKKAGKKLPRGQAVMIRIKNSDGIMSPEYSFTR